MPDPDLEIRGAGHPDPEIGGVTGLQKIFFGLSGLSLIFPGSATANNLGVYATTTATATKTSLKK